MAVLRAAPDRVIAHASPDEIGASFSTHVGLGLALDEPAHATQQLVQAIADVARFSVRTDHPMFFNQNFAGADPIAVVGDWLGAALNTTAATYEVAPVFTLMENAVIAAMARLLGWDAGDHTAPAPGVFCPGGSTANLYALHMARVRANASNERLRVYTSDQAHYSIEKAVALAGLGSDSLVVVQTDDAGRMRPEALREAMARDIAAGARPAFVNVTAGTTVLGAFDDVVALAKVVDALSAEHRPWLHIDGCFGGSALFSKRLGLLEGASRADSMVWNLHKMVGATQQCSVLLAASDDLAVFSTRAEYLFQEDKAFAALDLGDRTFQCARRVDSLKAWLLWKARGTAYFAERVEHAVAQADGFAKRVADDERFAIAAPPSWVNVCFWWLPPALRGRSSSFDHDALSAEDQRELGAIAPLIKAKMQREGETLIGYQPVKGRVNAFRMLFIAPQANLEHGQRLLEIVDRLGLEAVAEGTWARTRG